MAADYDTGYARICELVEQSLSAHCGGLNEADTRLFYIDTLLFECLDWQKVVQVKTEVIDSDGGRVDYHLAPNSLLLAIAEAKKEGTSFELPVESGPNQRIRKTRAIANLSKDVRAAMHQVAEYALARGAPIAIACNGKQWIGFCPNVGLGRPWDDGNCVVFSSLEDIRDGFPQFWKFFSTKAVGDLSLQVSVSLKGDGVPPPKRASSIHNFGRAKQRNQLQTDLQILGDLVFGGGRIFDDREKFHKYCYCPSGAVSQVSAAARSYLEDRYPELFSTSVGTPTLEPAQTKKGAAAALLNVTNVSKPILLLGDVGVGKTTFVEHLYLVDWKDRQKDLLVIRVDLGESPSNADDVPRAVTSQIEETLRASYQIDIKENSTARGILRGQLQRFERGPVGQLKAINPEIYATREINFIDEQIADTDNYFRATFDHLVKGRRKIVILVIDNVDQRNEEIQSRAFIQAQIAASKWNVYVLVALRPSTFVKNKLRFDVSGYHPRAFTVHPPRFDKLIQRRIEGGKKVLTGDEAGGTSLGQGITVSAHSTADFLDVLAHSFEVNQELAQFCEDMSNGDMRLAQEYLVGFMSCGHVDATKILDKWRRSGYQIPPHEFMRGVMFGEYEHYSEDRSPIVNVFDVHTADSREHFLLPALLEQLHQRSYNDSPNPFLPVPDIQAQLASTGFIAAQILWLLERALKAGLVENELRDEFLNETGNLRITPRGSYYHTVMIRRFVYIDAVLLDTPIHDDEVRGTLTVTSDLESRARRSEVFIDYLARTYQQGAFSGDFLAWTEIEADLRSDIERALSGAKRASKRRLR